MAIYKHSTKPEWAFGIIVEEREGKAFLRFDHQGEVALKDELGFRSQLVPVALPEEEAKQVVERLSKGVSFKGAGRTRSLDAFWSKIVLDPRRNVAIQSWSVNGYTGVRFVLSTPTPPV